MKIAYEPHPVSKERKAELRSQGFRIIDARFAPAGHSEPKAEPKPASIPTKSDIAGMKKRDCIEWLEAHGVSDPDGSVAELREELREIMYLE